MRCALLRAALSAACLIAVAAHKDSIRPRRKLADQAVPLTGAQAVPATGATPLVMEAKPAAKLILPDFSILFPLRPANLQTPTGTFAFQVRNAGAEAVCKGKGNYRVMVALDPESPKGTTISAPVARKGYRAQVIRNSQAIVYTFEGTSVPAESTADFSGTITMPTTGTARLVITADYQNKVQEAIEENNSSTLDIATAGVNDLMALFGTVGEGHKAPREANMPTSIKVEVGKDGKTRPTPKQLTFTVTNDGPFNVAVAPGAYSVTLSLDPKTAPAKTGLVFHKQKGPKGYTVSGDAHKLTYTLQSGVIPPGDTEFAYSLMVGEAGSVELVVVADATGAVEEMVKKNNMAQTTFPVVPTTKTVKYRRTTAHVN